jgi:hypothetical protein
MDSNCEFRRRKQAAVESEHRCGACGQRATAAWHGAESTLAVCSLCAQEVLPQMLADAVQIVGQRDSELRDIFNRIESRFWRAMALRLHKEKRQGTA